jgi:hypothetical protein
MTFALSIDVHTPVTMGRRSILTGIVHLFLKSFLESARFRTYGRCGYQQMQVRQLHNHLIIFSYVFPFDFFFQIDLAFTSAVLGTYVGAGELPTSLSTFFPLPLFLYLLRILRLMRNYIDVGVFL